MNNIIRLILPLALLSALAVAAPAGAATQVECASQIDQLRVQTLATASFTNDRDRANLADKLFAASSELAAGKPADALGKLGDFRAKVVRLGETGKLGAEDAAALTAGADSAIGCVQPLLPPA
jgi:hypothetical protein